jgi:hypothetical protein
VSEAQNPLRDCGQDGTCVYSPGCVEHMLERNRELLAERDSARAEVARLQKLFDDAGEGEHNVLALLDHYMDREHLADTRADKARDVVDAAFDLCSCVCDDDALVARGKLSAALEAHYKSMKGEP